MPRGQKEFLGLCHRPTERNQPCWISLPHKAHLLRTAKVLRQLLNDKTIRQVLSQFATDSGQDLSRDWGCTDALTVVVARLTSVGHPGQSRERWTNEHPHSARA